MVINLGAIKSDDWQLVQRDVEAVVAAAKGKARVKVILETSLTMINAGANRLGASAGIAIIAESSK